MTEPTIKNKIARAIEIEQQQATLDAELKAIKTALKEEAASREDEQKPTDEGGWSWSHEDSTGHLCRVTQPGRKLKSKVDPEAKGFDKVVEASGKFFNTLFRQVPAYKPVEGFRDEAVAHLGRNAQKLIKLVSSEAAMTVNFETAEKAS